MVSFPLSIGLGPRLGKQSSRWPLHRSARTDHYRHEGATVAAMGENVAAIHWKFVAAEIDER
jgi:hypothetical protein